MIIPSRRHRDSINYDTSASNCDLGLTRSKTSSSPKEQKLDIVLDQMGEELAHAEACQRDEIKSAFLHTKPYPDPDPDPDLRIKRQAANPQPLAHSPPEQDVPQRHAEGGGSGGPKSSP